MTAWPASMAYSGRLGELINGSRAVAFASRTSGWLKIVLDVVLTSVLLVAALPLMLVCIALIKLASPGPAILRQKRLGKNGVIFDMYKLRTMYRDAEVASGPVLAAENDRRIVPICRWMRRSHVDELPQLINVLRGEMTLVGPRPERPELAEQIYRDLPEFRYRLHVRPGITGLAQVRNGYDTCLDAVRQKLAYDMEYVRRRTLLLDLWILMRTVTRLYDATAR